MELGGAGSRVRTARRSFVAVVALLLSCVALTAPAAASTEPDDDDDRLLGLVTARGGTFRETADGHRLILTGVVPRATWFSDRPAREVGSFTIDEVTEVFFDGDDAPNAALEIVSGRGAGDVIVIEISNPRYQAGRGRLTLDAQVLGEDDIAATALQHHAARSTGDVPARFGPAALYIDDASACPSSFWSFAGELNSLSGISCTAAQQVVVAATAAHPENDGSGQYIYDFLFATEFWNAIDQTYQASFARTDHDVQQSFAWTCTDQHCGGSSGGGGGGNPGEEPE